MQKKYLPKLFSKFEAIDLSPQMYASRWFITLFADYFPMELVVRIFDIYLMEGRKILFRIALAIFKLLEKELMPAEDQELPLTLMKGFPKVCNCDAVLV